MAVRRATIEDAREIRDVEIGSALMVSVPVIIFGIGAAGLTALLVAWFPMPLPVHVSPQFVFVLILALLVLLIVANLFHAQHRVRATIDGIVADIKAWSNDEREAYKARAAQQAVQPPPAKPAPLEEQPPSSPIADLRTSTTNQANADFNLSLKILEATLQEMSKVADGEKLNGKPFAYDRCQAAGFVNRYEDWSRLMNGWESAEIADHPRHGTSWKLNVKSLAEGERRLSRLYAESGYVRVNGVWMKK